jgi:hypothetical protein
VKLQMMTIVHAKGREHALLVVLALMLLVASDV